MIVERITGSEHFRKIGSSWHSLLQSSEDNSIFFTHEWFSSWWKSFSADKSLEILLFKDKQGELIGIAPLMVQANTLQFIASQEVTDYCDFIVLKGRAEEFYSKFLEYLKIHYSTAEKTELINIKSSSPTLTFLPRFASKHNIFCSLSEAEVTPALDLPPSYEDFLSFLTRKNRHELKRKLKRIENLKGVKTVKIKDSESLKTAIEIFIELHKESDPLKEKFWRKKGMFDFFREMILQFSKRRWVELVFLYYEAKIMASLLNFIYEDKVLFYNIAYNRDYAWYSPGLFLFNNSIKNAISKKKKEADFLRGREKYKYYFGAKESKIFSLTLTHGVKKNEDLRYQLS